MKKIIIAIILSLIVIAGTLYLLINNENAYIQVTQNIVKAGEVTPKTGIYKKNKHIALKASENEGYRFVKWTVDGKDLSDEKIYVYTVKIDTKIVAVYEKVE